MYELETVLLNLMQVLVHCLRNTNTMHQLAKQVNKHFMLTVS